MGTSGKAERMGRLSRGKLKARRRKKLPEELAAEVRSEVLDLPVSVQLDLETPDLEIPDLDPVRLVWDLLDSALDPPDSDQTSAVLATVVSRPEASVIPGSVPAWAESVAESVADLGRRDLAELDLELRDMARGLTNMRWIPIPESRRIAIPRVPDIRRRVAPEFNYMYTYDL